VVAGAVTARATPNLGGASAAPRPLVVLRAATVIAIASSTIPARSPVMTTGPIWLATTFMIREQLDGTATRHSQGALYHG
jgi:hypothetical protein